jgi:hypothetical protein
MDKDTGKGVHDSFVLVGTWSVYIMIDPALKRWAIIIRPRGTIRRPYYEQESSAQGRERK